MPKSNNFYYTMIANCAYSKIKLLEFDKALDYLNEVESILGLKMEVWHLTAKTYVLYKLGREAMFNEYLKKTKNHSGYNDELNMSLKLYPDLSHFLTEEETIPTN